ncbi:B12-binding domain-containing protein [Thauera phenylacetica]|jgi:5-methyltetrahydrofolate--homocysteine methyltransferase|uniref:Cobalamin B12-binding domain-containing protein n=1 Tax=Thauera phenylacetica B4P TaxID=1234382 RepID=N6ZTZ7_9RHOO|nr:cobalamin-dependent protein [Thauera phenylacetica]ENO95619.1 cobalamin B12-binding domain-containing protein [Thauera phenylacetica B4P]MBP7639727.1 cobalamin-dependent protein [Thauera sp.]HRM70179.1 cobalamin-dependent protein [Thauera phenylacetica]
MDIEEILSGLEGDERDLVAWLADMNEDDALALANRMLFEDTKDPLRVLELCRMAMDIVGKRFEEGEYFLPELVLAGEMLDQVGAIAKPLLADGEGGGAKKLGRVLVGTVHGDLHDIGKNIVSFMLDINGYEVRDIGIDVPVATFIDEVRSFKPDVVALSGFLTLAFDSMKETVEAFEREGLRSQFKIMVGGGQIDEAVRAYTGADAFGVNAVEAVNLCNRWLRVAA